MKYLFLLAVSSLLSLSQLAASERFSVSDSTGIITDTVTGLEWFCSPDVEVDWLEAFVWFEELGSTWRYPSIEELIELHEAGITFDDPEPFELGGNWVWYGDLSNYDSVYCFDFGSGHIRERIAEWNAFAYVSGFRALAVRGRG
jgi:hypothetical protein